MPLEKDLDSKAYEQPSEDLRNECKSQISPGVEWNYDIA